MSSPERIFGEVRDKSIEVSEVNVEYHKKKKVKKRFGVECKWLNMPWRGRYWVIWGWYATAKQRDEALKTLRKNQCNLWKGIIRRTGKPCGVEFRSIER